ncbi:hypothetical protein ASPTUDRAFT_196578 [Aspergillus tubingensis CBS 134.48]|uniref:Uncharacterized protein n=1 Tax=Aspergillus tubingensis (strain CBS 134.48) TaxID=767770 RepID=A0A1L9NG51_ASPTC|nr:hypothetical protein ASPTUDRAFT_196578 [Aspergillus tubingensis CBS 134.48]
MDYRSGRLLAHTDAFPSSSSALPRRRWSQLNPLHASPVVETVRPLQQTAPYRYEPALDESSRAHRTTTLRQLNGNPGTSSWRNHNRSATSRPSTSASQPVLVRAYSGGPHDTSSTSTTMPSRRSFPFIGGSRSQRRGPALPSEDDFSIDGILRAIEPNIRQTLDSIGEICGRSRLSLANEYGSHIAPLGEIRAPPGGLVTVEEASSDHERQSDNVVIYDDENSVADGRDHSSLSQYRHWDGRRPSTGFPFRTPFSGAGSSSQAPPSTPRSPLALHAPAEEPALGALPTRQFASKPNSGGRTLLGTQTQSGSNILTPALVSEVLLDAQAEANATSSSEIPRGQELLGPSAIDSSAGYRGWIPPSLVAEVQALLSWLQYGAVAAGSDARQATAEMRLRAMLERDQTISNA